MKCKIIVSILLLSFSASIYAGTPVYHYYGKTNAFNFNNESLIVLESLFIKPRLEDIFDRGITKEKILFINFKEKSAKEIVSSKETLWPLLVDPSQQTILYSHEEKSQAVLYDVLNKKNILTIKRALRKARVIEDNGTKFWFEKRIDGIKKLYDVKEKKFINSKNHKKKSFRIKIIK